MTHAALFHLSNGDPSGGEFVEFDLLFHKCIEALRVRNVQMRVNKNWDHKATSKLASLWSPDLVKQFNGRGASIS